MIRLSAASATVAVAGPYSSAHAMKKTSATEMLDSAEPSCIVNEPVTMAAAANSSHWALCGAVTRDASARPKAAQPATVMPETYTCSERRMRLLSIRIGQRRAPNYLLVPGRVGRAPDDLLSGRVVDLRTPDDLVSILLRAGPCRDLSPNQRIGRDRLQCVGQAGKIEVAKVQLRRIEPHERQRQQRQQPHPDPAVEPVRQRSGVPERGAGRRRHDPGDGRQQL